MDSAHLQQQFRQISEWTELIKQQSPGFTAKPTARARTCVYAHHKMRLFHYESTNIGNTPLLIVFATINRPDVLDLFPETSFLQQLLTAGFEVYLLDWGYPDASDVMTSFADQVATVQKAIQYIYEKNEHQPIDLLGICQGGLISLCAASLSQQLRKLTFISTPVDFHTPDHLTAQLLQKLPFSSLVNFPGLALTQFFISLRPFETVGKKYLRMLESSSMAEKERFLRVEQWLYDAPDQPGQAFYDFIHEFYQENKLVQNRLVLNGQPISLKNITIPVLNLMAEQDHIVPVSASECLGRYIGSQAYQAHTITGGHIGIYISQNNTKQLTEHIREWCE